MCKCTRSAIYSIDPIDPIDPTDQTDPIDPIGSINEIDPIDPIGPIRTGDCGSALRHSVSYTHLTLPTIYSV